MKLQKYTVWNNEDNNTRIEKVFLDTNNKRAAIAQLSVELKPWEKIVDIKLI